MTNKADTLILGNIVPLSERSTYVRAMAVKDGKIQYLGSEKWARRLCDEDTKVLDYGDNFVYPGFIEAHCHGSLAGLRMAFFADLTAGTSMAEYVDIMKAYIEAHPDNDFYYGAGWKELDPHPTAAMLDAICPDKPIALNSIDGHSVWLNTPGMAKFGIDAEAVEYWGTNLVRVDDDGAPTGYISEGPAFDILKQMGKLSKEDTKKAFLTWQDFALSLGFTAYYEAGADESFLPVIRELIDEGKWKLRMYAGWLMDEHSEDYVADVRKAREMAEKYNCELLKIIGVKVFMDGVIEAHTGWMLEEYSDMPGYTGIKRFSDPERVAELYAEANRMGLNVHAHCLGDGAAHFALDCIEAAQLETGDMDARNAICHLQAVSAADVERLAQLNVVAVVAPMWMSRTDVALDKAFTYIGERRSYYAYPQKSFLDNNGVIAFHSDFPVSTGISIPTSIYMACTRNSPGAEDFYQLNPNERIGRLDALRGMASGAAYSVKEEDRLGKLEIGMMANVSVFDKDFLTCPLEEMPEAQWVATVIDGKEAARAQ